MLDAIRYALSMQTEAPTKRPRELVRPCCPPAALSRLSPSRAVQQASLFKALADPTRLQMLSLLGSAGEEVCICHIQERFELGQPTISHHLKVLREAGLIRCVKRGIWVYCSLVPTGLAALRSTLALFSEEL